MRLYFVFWMGMYEVKRLTDLNPTKRPAVGTGTPGCHGPILLQLSCDFRGKIAPPFLNAFPGFETHKTMDFDLPAQLSGRL